MNRLFTYAALLVALWAGYEAWAYHQRTVGRAQERAEQLERDLKTERDARAEEKRRREAQEENRDDYRQELDQARRAAAAAVDVGRRLRQQLEAIRQSGGACHTGAGQGSQATQPAEDLYAGVQRRLDEAADEIARFADESRAAGRLCERNYDALIAPAGP